MALSKKMPKRTKWSIKANPLAFKGESQLSVTIQEMNKIKPNKNLELITLSVGNLKGNCDALKPSKNSVKSIVTALHSKKWNGYQNIAGESDPKTALSKYLSNSGIKINPKDIYFTIGSLQALEVSIGVFATFGKNILCPSPGRSDYQSLAQLYKVKTKFYNLLPEKNWEIDVKSMHSLVDENTAAIIYCNPSHPCGTVYTREHIKQIIDFAKKFKLPIIADETSERLVFSSKVTPFIPIITLADGVPVLTCGSLSNRFMGEGWRFGWVTLYDNKSILGNSSPVRDKHRLNKNNSSKSIRDGISDLLSRTEAPNSLVHGALRSILHETPNSFHRNIINFIKENANMIVNGLKDVKGLRVIPPNGGVYVTILLDLKSFPSFQTDRKFCETLVSEQSVITLPSNCFAYSKPSIRITLKVAKCSVKEAVKRIKLFAQKHAK